jgi:hypothetical protein
MHAKTGYTSFKTFPFIHVLFSSHKVHNMLAMMLDPITRGWGWSFNILARRGLFKL